MASIINVDEIQGATAAANVKLPAGCILQVLSTTKTDTFSTTSVGPIDITGLSVSIAPKYATSKVLIMFDVSIVGYDSGTGIRLLRGSTTLALGDASSSRARMTAIGPYSNGTSPSAYSATPTSMSFLDSPATTSATTYKLQAQCLSTNGIVVNMTRYDTDNGNASRGSSTITVMEIAQ
tara:strand:- start:345 stop:881 length:537 start_codon:yes stop_codon:yes gene_type:complete